MESNRISVMSVESAASGNSQLPHQYHYIQYPAFYRHINENATAPAFTCNCPCAEHAQNARTDNHSHQNSIDSQNSMAVAVIVHRQSNSSERPTKTQSEQYLLNHSYQTLQDDNAEDKPLNVISCVCDLECTCEVVTSSKKKMHCRNVMGVADTMLGVDDITVSESDNNSTMIERKRERVNKKSNSWYNASNIDIYCDGDEGVGNGQHKSAIQDSCVIDNTDSLSGDNDHRPPLPPRPPPRARSNINAPITNATHRHGSGTVIKKYVVWCLICGGFSCLLGMLFLGVYFLLHSYTITVGNFETVPTFVPATLLILTGLCIMSLARRRNRYSYLIKLSGACGLISALTCALVTVTTTVLHMSRLQALRECEYAQKTRTCTCYSDLIESQVDRIDKESVRLVFDSLSDCGVVHGSLYSCLRAIFGLSVAGVLVAVFSCMLVYQLLSHERKKMYWEQLELRCRSLYTSQQGPPPNMASIAAARNGCRCCEQCHAHRQISLPASTYPWDEGGEQRFWTGQPPGNFYSPNPGGEDIAMTCRETNARSNRATGWSWPRMPWQRSSPDPNVRFRATPSSPDSQYGFSNNIHHTIEQTAQIPPQPYAIANGIPPCVWGPPPPYSDPNSPAHRNYYQYLSQSNFCTNSSVPNERQVSAAANDSHLPCRSAFHEPQLSSTNPCCVQTSNIRNAVKVQQPSISNNLSKGEYENAPSERDRFSNTLPTRKTKKRVEVGAKSIGPHSQPEQRINVQQVFSHSTATGVDFPTDCGNRNHAAESEVYFADVSSCCNLSVKNDSHYEDAAIITQHNHNSHQHQNSNCSYSSSNGNEEYPMQRCGNTSTRRLPCPQFYKEHLSLNTCQTAVDAPYEALHLNHNHIMHKEKSSQSMGSVESEAKTEFTDLSPATPNNPNNPSFNGNHPAQAQRLTTKAFNQQESKCEASNTACQHIATKSRAAQVHILNATGNFQTDLETHADSGDNVHRQAL